MNVRNVEIKAVYNDATSVVDAHTFDITEFTLFGQVRLSIMRNHAERMNKIDF